MNTEGRVSTDAGKFLVQLSGGNVAVMGGNWL